MLGNLDVCVNVLSLTVLRWRSSVYVLWKGLVMIGPCSVDSVGEALEKAAHKCAAI